MMTNILKFQLFLLIVFQLVLLPAQEVKDNFLLNPQGDTVYLKPVPLSEITSNIESAYDKIKKAEEGLIPAKEFLKFDSLYSAALKGLDSLKAVIIAKEEYSIKEINDKLNKWGNYSKILDTWNEKIKNRIKVLETHLFDLQVLSESWRLTLSGAKEGGVPDNVLSSATDLIKKINQIDSELKSAQTEALRKQNNITELRLIADEVITYFNTTRVKLQADFFRQDSPPLWAAADSSANLSNIKSQFNETLNQNQRKLIEFYESNSTTLLVHFLIFLALWIGFYFLHKQVIEITKEESSTNLNKSKYVVSKHSLSALILSLFISIWLYQTMVSVVNDIFQLFYLIIAILFLPGYIDKRLKTILYSLLALLIINEYQLFIPGKSLIARIFLLVESVLTVWILFKISSRSYFISQTLEKYKWGVLLKFIPIFYLFIGISIIGNIFGLVNLSILLDNTVVNALINLIILILVVMVLNRTLTILLRTSFFQKSNIIKNNLRTIEKNTFSVVHVIAVLLWFRSILKLLGVLPALNEWFNEAIQTSWKIGNSTIDVGGIINFILVIIGTSIFIRIVKSLLKDELYPRIKLPRGVPGAISMIVGYVLVGYGIFIALGAAGVNLSQFGLIAGALGVGIGFGLQGIVANFIAGLVLAFERPIQVGDTIKVGTMMGDVLSIGVRSCTIKTFDGLEVIIPNSTLITNDVTNFTLSDRKRRRDINVGVAYGTDPHVVMELMKKVANDHPEVQKIPAPWVLFDGFGDSSLDFRLRIWTTMDTGMTTKSDVTIAIYDALNKAGITIPFPQQDLYIKSLPGSNDEMKPATKKKIATKEKSDTTDKDENKN